MKKFFELCKPVIVLLAICLVVAAALAGANLLTKDRIAAQAEEAEQAARNALVPDASFQTVTFPKSGTDGYDFLVARNANGEEIARVFTVEAKGYGGTVKVMTAVANDATVLAVNIVDVSSETVGLGQNAAKPAFFEQFEGLEGGIGVNKTEKTGNDIKAITGATITSKAVTGAVNTAIERFRETQNFAIPRQGEEAAQ